MRNTDTHPPTHPLTLVTTPVPKETEGRIQNVKTWEINSDRKNSGSVPRLIADSPSCAANTLWRLIYPASYLSRYCSNANWQFLDWSSGTSMIHAITLIKPANCSQNISGRARNRWPQGSQGLASIFVRHCPSKKSGNTVSFQPEKSPSPRKAALP